MGFHSFRQAISRFVPGWTWFTRKRVFLFAALVLALEIGGVAVGTPFIDGTTVSYSRPSSDFVSFYAAGVLAGGGHPERAYHQAEHYAAELKIAKHKIVYNYFYYPPVFLMLCAALGKLAYIPAFFAFQLGTLALCLLVGRAIMREKGWAVLAPLMLFPAAFWTFHTGQNGFLTATLFGAATLALRSRPILAGLLFGALCYKPHLGLLVPIALATGGYWRAFLAAAASVAALVLLSLAVFGWATWHDYLIAASQSQATYESARTYLIGYTNPFGVLRAFGGSVAIAYGAQAFAALGAAVWVGVLWRSAVAFPVKAATLLAATPIAAPISLFYELLLSGIAMAWLLHDEQAGAIAPWKKRALIFLFVGAIFSGNMGKYWWHVPTAFLTAFGFFAIVAVHGWQEWRKIRNSHSGTVLFQSPAA